METLHLKLSKEDKGLLSEVLSVKKQDLSNKVNDLKKNLLTRINSLVKESKEENLKAKDSTSIPIDRESVIKKNQ